MVNGRNKGANADTPHTNYNLPMANPGKATHLMRDTPSYRIWNRIKDVCHNPYSRDYHKYGGRGVEVCLEWRSSFEKFYADMGSPPKGKWLDRRDNNGNYSPDNCRWLTPKEQMRNTSRNQNYTIDGVTKCVADWCDQLDINRSTMAVRKLRGWSKERLQAKLEEAYYGQS